MAAQRQAPEPAGLLAYAQSVSFKPRAPADRSGLHRGWPRRWPGRLSPLAHPCRAASRVLLPPSALRVVRAGDRWPGHDGRDRQPPSPVRAAAERWRLGLRPAANRSDAPPPPESARTPATRCDARPRTARRVRWCAMRSPSSRGDRSGWRWPVLRSQRTGPGRRDRGRPAPRRDATRRMPVPRVAEHPGCLQRRVGVQQAFSRSAEEHQAMPASGSGCDQAHQVTGVGEQVGGAVRAAQPSRMSESRNVAIARASRMRAAPWGHPACRRSPAPWRPAA